ncbi:MAG: rane-bound lytic murein transglycosylase [Rikenellaceae bacterium]|nr:rane-bound lytic murein transglycosylase [Rikenellaceae bacterium]MDN5355507.1 rane-bound lytic murein transglycosylase [Rikenellaceae bacterium]
MKIKNYFFNLLHFIKTNKIKLLLFLFFFYVLILTIIPYNDNNNIKQNEKLDFPELVDRGYLNAIVEHNSMSFFVHNGRLMGLQYDLLNYVSKRWNLKINQIVVNDLSEALALVAFDTIDILTSEITILPNRYPCLEFSIPLYKTKMVLVLYDSINPSSKIKNFSELNIESLQNKSIAVPSMSIFINYLNKLKDSLKINFSIRELSEEPESILDSVMNKKIYATVMDEKILIVNTPLLHNTSSYYLPYPSFDIGWAFSCYQPILRDSINQLLLYLKKKGILDFLLNKYQKPIYINQSNQLTAHSKRTKKLTPYDKILKKYGKEYGIDWRLVAALIYNESKFNVNAISSKGAFGIIQIMPETAEMYGITAQSPIDEQIKVSFKILNNYKITLKQFFKNEKDLYKAMIASYNLGLGHILDAINLAIKYEGEIYNWEQVSKWLLNKAQKKYYSDPIVRNGYCYGRITVYFVNIVFDTYENYVQLI